MIKLDEVVPVRVSRREKILLRRWARESGTDLSKVVRDMIERRRSEEAAKPESNDEQKRSDPSSVCACARSEDGVGVAA
jgi:hypothetical protein